MRTLLPLFAVIVSCSVLLSHGAQADPLKPTQTEIDRAHELFQRSKPLQDAKKYEEAAKLLTEAWSLQHSPDIATNLAMCEGMLGRYRDAAEHLSFALRNMPPSADAAQRERVAKAHAEAKREVVELNLTVAPERAEISIDGRTVGSAPFDGPLYVEPGERTITATAAGFVQKAEVVRAKKGQSVNVALVLERVASSPASSEQPANGVPPSPSSAPAPKSMLPVYIAGGVALVGLSGALVFELSRSSNATDAAALSDAVDPKGCGTGTATPSECADLHDKNLATNRAADLRNLSLIVGGAAVAIGIGYLLWPTSGSPSARTSAKTITAMPAVSPSQAGLFLSGTF
ncbi:MAG: PEGA domain-containing protein [Polyangiaceae bacterium]|nr:PEGA domain-containing protein [Polyangiaceae bacterium]MCE7888594.1 PEGA domain-containing protein [Sorangiineae bacterium PRO1]MCL4754131.1 PEGA domain-containing protein [Myxococcales bacterium]